MNSPALGAALGHRAEQRSKADVHVVAIPVSGATHEEGRTTGEPLRCTDPRGLSD